MYARDGLIILALPLQHSLSIAHKLHPAVDVLFLKRGKVLEVLFGFGGGGPTANYKQPVGNFETGKVAPSLGSPQCTAPQTVRIQMCYEH